MSVDAIAWVWKHSPYTGDTLLTHLAIADVVNDAHGNEFWMNPINLADKARCSERTARTALRKMLDDELLVVLERGGGRGKFTRFVFLMPESTTLWTTRETLRDLQSSDDGDVCNPRPETVQSTTPIERTQENTMNTSASSSKSVDKPDRDPARLGELRNRFHREGEAS